jgi:hypothetical protein
MIFLGSFSPYLSLYFYLGLDYLDLFLSGGGAGGGSPMTCRCSGSHYYYSLCTSGGGGKGGRSFSSCLIIYSNGRSNCVMFLLKSCWCISSACFYTRSSSTWLISYRIYSSSSSSDLSAYKSNANFSRFLMSFRFNLGNGYIKIYLLLLILHFRFSWSA